MANELLHLRVRNREKILIDEDVSAISTFNQKGIFDILPSHSNLISLIGTKIIFYDPSGKKKEMPLETAIMRVQRNTIDIYLDILKS